MLRRFVSASAIASIAVALAMLALLLIPGVPLQRAYPLIVIWCFAPMVWGFWGMLTPSGWVPQRLPSWGGILGLIAGLLAFFVLNLPFRLFGEAVPIVWRSVAVVAVMLVYYFLWMLVRLAYRSPGVPTSAA